MLMCAQTSVSSVAFIKWTSNTQLPPGIAFDSASPVNTGSMIARYGDQELRKERIKQELEMEDGRKGKLDFVTRGKGGV